jgi:uncharacterized protein
MQKQTRMLVVENFGSCNMRCTYCFPEHMWQRQGHRGAMTEETYRGVIERALATTDAESLDIHFAGGEPLIVGQSWFEMAFAAAREIAARCDKRVTFSMQSNANWITPELARFLVGNQVTVGVSLDGPPEINEAVRGNTDRTLAGLEHLSEAMGRRPGIIVTVTRCNALRMGEVVEYLDGLGVALFRANQMGATASWNSHAAPHAEEWARARQDILAEVAARRGRIMEFNLSQAITKLTRSLLHGASPFDAGVGCCDLRCPAGRQLLYFDQRGSAYACPRANVTVGARIAHYTAADFEARWDDKIRQLDAGMALPEECGRCPAQLVCDYGCHAFNVAQGNFFEVNCDATKDYFQWVTAHLDDVARVACYMAWRDQLKATEDFDGLRPGVELSPGVVSGLADRLRRRLEERLAEPDLTPETLNRRYGWRDDLVPVAVIDRQRVSERPATRGRAPKGGGNARGDRDALD